MHKQPSLKKIHLESTNISIYVFICANTHTQRAQTHMYSVRVWAREHACTCMYFCCMCACMFVCMYAYMTVFPSNVRYVHLFVCLCLYKFHHIFKHTYTALGRSPVPSVSVHSKAPTPFAYVSGGHDTH